MDLKRPVLIFDMDGTLLDNNPYHLKAWQAFFKRHGKILTEKEYKEQLSGINSATTIRMLLGKELSDGEVMAYRNEKEDLYRQLIEPYIQPLPGLISFLKTLQAEHVSTGIATSATEDNIRFAMNKLRLKKYFQTVVDATMVKNGKPDPEIYLTTAEKLNAKPEDCIVFEDSLNGIRGAKAAGMKVIALTTSHSRKELTMAEEVIDDYTKINLQQLFKMILPP